MQNKGLIRLFALLFGLVSIYQLSFTFISSKLERDAKAYATSEIGVGEGDYLDKRQKLEMEYLDSIGEISVLGYTSYDDAKKKELNKGLDLKGGINVTLQISVRQILVSLANETDNEAFNRALQLADERSENSQDTYAELFFQAFDEVKGDSNLSDPDIFANKRLAEKVDIDMTDEQVRSVILKEIDEAVDSAFRVLRERIDNFGVTQPNIQRVGSSGRIVVELPGAQDVDRAQKLLSSTAQLEFWETYPRSENAITEFMVQADQKLAEQFKAEEETDSTAVAVDSTSNIDRVADLLSSTEEDSTAVAGQANPLLEKLSLAPPGSNAFFVAAVTDTAEISSYLSKPEILRLLPPAIRYSKFAWERPTEDSEVAQLFVLKSNRNNKPRISGDVVTDAQATFDQFGKPAVSMSMNTRGAREWERLTGEVFEQQNGIAIVLDNKVYTAPGVSKGPISGGRSEITGQFTPAETKDIATILRAGKLPAKAEIIQSEVVGPSLGREAIKAGFNSFLIAMILVLVWMAFYYGRAGWFADIALALNILLIFGVLSSLRAVLTLPGIAGIVLTIGMSVDANVLIFERIKEELDRGKGMAQAIKDGFDKAIWSILDANITTFLTAVILFWVGSGPIKGFATTLMIGIATSLFTAIFVTRLIIESYLEGKKKRTLAFCTPTTKTWLKNFNFAFLKNRRWAYMVSGALILISLISLGTKGLQQGIDLLGGRTYVLRFDREVNPREIKEVLVTEFGTGTNVKTYGRQNQVKMTTSYKIRETGLEVDKEIQESMFAALTPFLPDGYSLEDFVEQNENKTVGILESVKVGPTIADDIKNNAYMAVLGSLIIVFLYILVRFSRWQFSLGAVTAVFHDVLLVLGLFSLIGEFMPFSMEIDQAIIAAILTVIGYSLNDTVVVFDRIRETIGLKGWNNGEHVNDALNSTLSRTLNTSLTTLIVLISIFIFGGESLRGFMFAMIVGVIVGTYSSVFIATPVMFESLPASTKDGSAKSDKDKRKVRTRPRKEVTA